MKTCKKCHKQKPPEDFSFSASHADNKHPFCRECRNKMDKRYKERKKKIEYTLEDDF